MPQLDASGMIAEWTAEYPIVGDIVFDGYTISGTKTYAQTSYPDVPHIALNTRLMSHPVWGLACLWHEYAHAAAYYENARKGQQHNDKWRGWLWKKPILAILDHICPALVLL